MTTSIRIDPEFKSLIPPLSADEYAQLEANIVADGIRDPLVVWEVPNGDMILLDGHNRFEIAAKHGGIPFDVKKLHFTDHDRERAQAWMLKNQLGRRNISLYDRGLLGVKLKNILADTAKAKEHDRKTTLTNSSKSEFPAINARRQAAKEAGASEDTLRKVEEIEEKASEATKQAIRSGQKSINSAWLEIKERERQQADLSAKAHLEQAVQRHEDLKTAPVVSIDDIKQDSKDVAEIAESKRQEIENAIKKILFIGGTMAGGDADFSVINRNTIGAEGVRALTADITKAIDVLSRIQRSIGR